MEYWAIIQVIVNLYSTVGYSTTVESILSQLLTCCVTLIFTLFIYMENTIHLISVCIQVNPCFS